MREKVLFLGTGVINDGRFNFFHRPFVANGVECYVVSRFPERKAFGTQGAFKNYYIYDYMMDENRALDELENLSRSLGITKIMTLFEDAVVLGAKLRERLGIEGMRYSEAIRFTDKHEMKRRLSEHGIPCTGFIDEFIAGSEMSCDSMVCKGRVVYAAATKYDPSISESMENEAGGLSVVLLNDLNEIEHAKLTDFAQRVVNAMGFKDGFAHIKIFQTSKGYIVDEIAASLPGARIVDLHNVSQGMNVGDVYYDIMIRGATDFVFKRDFSSGVYFITSAQQGKVTRVDGSHIIWSLEGLVDCRLPSVGSRVRPKSYSFEDIGYILLKSKSSGEISRALGEARKAIKVSVAEDTAANEC